MKKFALMMCMLLGFSHSFPMAPYPDPDIVETLVGIHSDVSKRRNARIILGMGIISAGLAAATVGIQGNISAGAAFSFATLLACHGAYTINSAGEALERLRIRRLLNNFTNTSIPEKSRMVLAKMCRQAGASHVQYLCEAGAYEELEEYVKENPDEIHQRSPGDNVSLLMRLIEIRADRSRALETLLRHGADPNEDNEGALLYYSLPRDDYTRRLLEYGTDPCKKRTAIMEPFQVHGDVFELLDSHGSNGFLVRVNKRMIRDGHDAYLQKSKARIRNYAEKRVSRLFNGPTLQPSELPTSLPNEVCLKIAEHVWELSHPKMAALDTQIEVWRKYKENELADLNDV